MIASNSWIAKHAYEKESDICIIVLLNSKGFTTWLVNWRENSPCNQIYQCNMYPWNKFITTITILLWSNMIIRKFWNNIGVNALFVPTFSGHFYFGPYISILLLLVLNPINACYFSTFRHSTNRKNWRGKRSALLTQ